MRDYSGVALVLAGIAVAVSIASIFCKPAYYGMKQGSMPKRDVLCEVQLDAKQSRTMDITTAKPVVGFQIEVKGGRVYLALGDALVNPFTSMYLEDMELLVPDHLPHKIKLLAGDKPVTVQATGYYQD